ncbi:MAG: nicotinate-nicotinamide nucleotide adenylyltransferase [Terriglobales bacterium]
MMNVGILGGTFDPPHRGHLRMAAAVERACELERIYFVPAPHPWHKTAPLAGFCDRYAMLALTLMGHPRWQPLALPESALATYSVHQVSWLQNHFPRQKLHFIVGADSFATLPTWKQPRRLLGLCDFIVLAREGAGWEQVLAALPRGWVHAVEAAGSGRVAHLRNGGKIHWLPRFSSRLSSTSVRQWLARAPRAPMPVTPAVNEFARRAGLYQRAHA